MKQSCVRKTCGKKALSRRGQASVEYFLLLAAIGVLTVISTQRLWPDIREALQGSGGFFVRTADRLTNADLHGTSSGPAVADESVDGYNPVDWNAGWAPVDPVGGGSSDGSGATAGAALGPY